MNNGVGCIVCDTSKPNYLAKISNRILLRFLRYIYHTVEVAQRIKQILLHFSENKDVESDYFLLRKLHVSEKINVSIINILFEHLGSHSTVSSSDFSSDKGFSSGYVDIFLFTQIKHF